MRFCPPFFATLFLLGCSSPDKDAERDRERSREEITRVIEDVIAAMREHRPEAYHAHLCRSQRDAYPLEEMRREWTESRALLEQQAASMKVKTVAIDKESPDAATVLVSAPAHPRQNLMFEAIREEGVWKIREPRVEAPRSSGGK
jgi:hypothetical protein